MNSIEKVIKFNAQTAGREKLIRLCQYLTKFVNSILHLYYTKYAKGGVRLLEILFKLKELEQYFTSCRRLISFGRCTDQLYSAIRSLQLTDPIIRMTSSTSKLWLASQMLSEHILWLNQMQLITGDKKPWVERANKFWLYATSVNLLRDFYELVCLVQQRRSRNKDNLDSEFRNFTFATPIKWMRKNPKLSCDLIKNSCDFWIPYTAVNKIQVHPSIIALLGIISTTMGILQVYDRDYRLSPS